MTHRNETMPAFPTSAGVASDDEKSVTYTSTEPGMTKREYMAITLLPAVIAATSAGLHMPVKTEGEGIDEAMARDAVNLADALLRELAK